MKLIRVEHPKPGMRIVYSCDGVNIYRLSKGHEYYGTIIDPMEDKDDGGRIRVRWVWHEDYDEVTGSCPKDGMYFPPSSCAECEGLKTDPNDYLCGECRGLVD